MGDESITHKGIPTRLKYAKVPKNLIADTSNKKKKPSQYLSEIKGDTASLIKNIGLNRVTPKIIERLDVSQYTHQTECSVSEDEPLFQPFPPEITFRGYEPYKSYEVTLTLRNNDKAARRIKLLTPSIPLFSISIVSPSSSLPSSVTSPVAGSRGSPFSISGGERTLNTTATKKDATGIEWNSKVAPGMEVAFLVKFSPDSMKDYHCDLVCMTEREKFAIPLVAIGSRGALDFPDEVVFDNAPVKSSTPKTFLVRNVGNRECKFSFHTSLPFSIFPTEGFLEINSSTQVSVNFNPETIGESKGEIEIEYDSGETVYSQIKGKGSEVDIRFEKNIVKFPPAYITLSARKTFRIFNKSDIKVQFAWKTFATRDEELLLSNELEASSTSIFDEQMFDGSDTARSSMLTQKKSLKAALESSKQLFRHDQFKIEPLEGEIWPSSQVEISVFFYPKKDNIYDATAYCETNGRCERMPLRIRGKGVGPKATFSFDVLDIGEVYVNSLHKYEVTIQNAGNIEVPFKLQPSQDSRFEFTPAMGRLGLGEMIPIEITFKPDSLGDFYSVFEWSLAGCGERLPVSFKGKVLGPTFHFDTDSLDFGVISYGFTNTRVLHLTNTSEIPMRYQLRVPSDIVSLGATGEGDNTVENDGFAPPVNKPEFEICPIGATVMPFCKQKITVDFTSFRIRKYEAALVVDVDGVGRDMLELPIRADCKTPKLGLSTSLLDFGECFIGHTYEKQIHIDNATDLPGRFAIIPQDDSSLITATISTPTPKGVVPAKRLLPIVIALTPARLGPLNIPLYFRVSGSLLPPMELSLTANVLGPTMKVEKNEVKFGKIPVLIPAQRRLKVTNESLITAEFKVVLKSKFNCFSASMEEGVLAPQESTVIVLTAVLDEPRGVDADLQIIVKYANTMQVKLSAKGTGTTVVFPEWLSKIDMGTKSTNFTCSKVVTLENKGKIPQYMEWHNEKAKRGRRFNATDGEEHNYIFEVSPSSATIEPGSSVDFLISGATSTPGKVVEKLVVTTVIDKNTKTTNNVEVVAEFANPLLRFSSPVVNFFWAYAPHNGSPRLMTQPLTLKNVSEFPLRFSLRIPAPFGLAPEATSNLHQGSEIASLDFRLESGDSVPVVVTFNPNYRSDFATATVKQKLVVIYHDHPHKESIDMVGEVAFPNLTFSLSSFDFGATLNDVDKQITVEIKNVSKVEAVYTWAFEELSPLSPSVASIVSQPLSVSAQSTRIPETTLNSLPTRPSTAGTVVVGLSGINTGIKKDISEVFDVLPIRGCIPPGGKEQMLIVYHGQTEQNYDGMCVCSVAGGPTYKIPVKGESSAIHYRLERRVIEFGPLPYKTSNTKDLSIFNVGKVPFTFKIGIGKLKDARIEVNPSSGAIAPNEKVRLNVKFTPTSPSRAEEQFTIQVAHFPPENITIFGEGIFHHLTILLPRANEKEFTALLEEVNKDKEYTPVPPSYPATEFSPRSRAGSLTLGSGRKTHMSAGPKSVIMTKEPSNMQIEADHEVERLIIRQVLETEPRLIAIGDDKSEVASVLEKITLGSFICDFGNVVKGTHKSRSFKVSNTGSLPVTFDIDKKLLQASGCSIDPEKIKRLPGGESITFNAVFQANSQISSDSKVDTPVPFAIRGGPIYNISLRANVIVPDVAISMEKVEFGPVLCGHCMFIYVCLSNNKAVECDWEARFFKTAKDSNCFKVEPESGKLAPGESVNVSLRFAPLEPRKYVFQLPIKINKNNSDHVITCKGMGTGLSLNFTPELVKLGPILPHQNEPAESVVELSNPTDYPIEVYSVDFDTKYLEEEELLNNAEGYKDGELLLPPRAPGEPLPEHVRRSRLEATEDANTNVPSATVGSGGNLISLTPTIDDGKHAETQKNIVLFGPRHSGKSTLAQTLASKYKLPLVKLDEVLEKSRNMPPLFVGVKFPESSLVDAFLYRFREGECSRGVIIDGLDSKYATEETITNAMLKAIETSKWGKNSDVIFYHISSSLATARMRRAEMMAAEEVEIDEQITQLKSITEEEYDRMSQDKKNDYEKQTNDLKRKKKDIINSIKTEMQRLEEERKREEELKLLELEKLKTPQKGKGKGASSKSSTRSPSRVKSRTGDVTIRDESPTNGTATPDKEDPKTSPVKRKRKEKEDKDEATEPQPIMSFVDELSRQYYEHQVAKNSIISLLESKNGEIKIGSHSTDGTESTAAPQEHSLISPSLSMKEIDGEKEKDIVKEELLSCIPFIPEAQDEAHPEQKKMEVPPPKTFLVHKKPSAHSHTPTPSPAHHLRTHGHVSTIPQEPLPKKATHFNIKTLYEEPTLGNDALKDEKETEEDSEHGFGGAPLIPTMSTVQLVPGKKGKDRKSKDADMEAGLSGPSSYSLVPGTPPSNGKKKSLKKELAKPKKKDPDLPHHILYRTRWIVPPKSSRQIHVCFNAEAGSYDEILTFGICGSSSRFTLRCKGTAAFPRISSDPKVIFPIRVKSTPASGQAQRTFVSNSQTFMFGPLQIGKSREGFKECKDPTTFTKLKVVNDGLFDCKVEFAFRDGSDDAFLVDPSSMDIAKGQTKDVTVFAYPNSVGNFKDELLFFVADNPEVIKFSVACAGVKPQLEIDKHLIQFDRLLLQRDLLQSFTIKNISPLALAWKVNNPDALGEGFTISPTSGAIQAFQQVSVGVHFTAVKPLTLKKTLRIEATDLDNGSTVQTESVVVSAESYNAVIDIQFPKGSGGVLNYGNVHIGEESKQIFTLKNKGKYPLAFQIVTEKYSKMFTAVPSEGIVAPDKTISITVTFSTQQEIVFNGHPDVMKCVITEPRNKDLIVAQPIRISAQSSFSKYSISPLQNINFGPLVYGSKASRSFVITNNGLFDFRFTLQKMDPSGAGVEGQVAVASPTPTPPPPLTPTSTTIRKSKSAAGNKSKTPSEKDSGRKQMEPLVLGNFVVSPALGLIHAGGSQKINIDFNAETGGVCSEVLLIDVVDRDPTDHPELGIPFEIAGEVCIPGIATDGTVLGSVSGIGSADLVSVYESIFEEQVVTAKVEALDGAKSAYALHERVFVFKTVVLGSVIKERIKISNPNKVACQVSVGVRSREPVPKGATVEFPFDVEPKKLTIPSHDSQFVTVTFSPSSMQTFSGIFEAIVQNTPENKNKKLVFEIKGEATLPHILIHKPLLQTKSGCPLLRFNKLLLGKTQTLPIVLFNEGIIAANVKIDFGSSKVFSSTNSGALIASKSSHQFDVTFSPFESKKTVQDLKLVIDNNHFEDMVISAQGEGYVSDVSIELADENEEELFFGENPVGVENELSLTLRSHCGFPIRFSWPQNQSISFAPSVGHLQPRAAKTILVNFHASTPISLKGLSVPCKIQKINYANENNFQDWDDTRRSVTWSESRPSSSMGTARRIAATKKVEVEIEPPYQVVDDYPNTDLDLRIHAQADFIRYDCSSTPILFKPTLMFQARVHTFAFKNTSASKMDFSWKIHDTETGEDIINSPFTISPTSGTIPPQQTINFNIRFAPIDENFYDQLFLCTIPHLHHMQEPPQVQVRGESQRPICHFEIPISDYLSNSTSDYVSNSSNFSNTRRNPSLPGPYGRPGPLDPKTRVIELVSCGVKVRNSKKFYIVNPTFSDYEFVWESNNVDDDAPDSFRCLTKKGIIKSMKKFEIVFEFTPEDLEVKESFWTFKIPQHNISLPFLLAGLTHEPDVFLDRSHVHFTPLLLSHSTKEHVKIINNENIPLHFTVEKSTEKAFVVSPGAGTLPPRSSTDIEVSFVPDLERRYNFNVVFMVKRKPSRLTLNLKGEGYAIHDSLSVDVPEGKPLPIVPNEVNVVDFGAVQVNDKNVKIITIDNSGKFPFDFKWDYQRHPNVSLSPVIGTVNPEEKLQCELSFHPTREQELENYKLICKITNGHKFGMILRGKGSKPALEFSFFQFDFGPCFLHRQGNAPKVATLKITNKDQQEISFDSTFTNKPHLEAQITPTVLKSRQSVDIPITFIPRDSVQYKELIPFKINGLNTVNIEIIGEGTDIKVDLMDESQKNVNFGALRIGQTAHRTIKIVNRSKCDASISLQKSVWKLKNYSLSFTPNNNELVLKPKQVLPLSITFQPNERIPSFTEKLLVDVAGNTFPLLYISGACQGVELKLDTEMVTFGPVVKGGYTKRKIHIKNVGDIGSKFIFNKTAFAPDFAIKPLEGFLSPGMEATLTISFRPTDLNSDIRYEKLKCTIEGSPSPLLLSLLGSCVGPPANDNEMVNFKTPVRTKQSRIVTISNKTNTLWKLKPNIDNVECWTGEKIGKQLEISPGSSANYELSYYPLSMTNDKAKHKGSLFFALPDGGSLVYDLVGQAVAPISSGEISKKIPCKVTHVEELTVKNWLKVPQRFKVFIEIEGTQDPATALKGLDYIDVPGLMDRQYKLSFHSYRECTTNAKIVFRNEDTKEYLFYSASFIALPPDALKRIDLESPVRQIKTFPISVENPLGNIAVTFTASCNNPEISFPPSFTIPASGVGTFELTFLPLAVRETTSRLTLSSDSLGLYHYDLSLKSTPPNKEKNILFKVPIGGRHTQTFRFTNFLKTKTEFTVKTDCPDFETEKTLTVGPSGQGGTEVGLDVHYEPSKVGSISANLSVTSAQGVEYSCTLIGHALPPKPQGPIVIKTGSSFSLPFKNVFSKPTQFIFSVDNNKFSVRPSDSTIGVKKVQNISITYKNPTPNATTLGKLTISSAGNATFIFYLKGVS